MRLFVLLVVFSTATVHAQSKKMMYVADHKDFCTGTSSSECYLIKEKKNADWRVFQNNIEGFEYSEGFEYKLKVSVRTYNNVEPGSSNLTYQLLKVMSKRKTDYNPLQKLDGTWHLLQIWEDTTYIKLMDTTSVMMELNTTTQKMSGKNICNNFFSPFTASADSVSFGNIGSTRMMCDGMMLENIIFRMYKDMSKWTVRANKLLLTSTDGKTKMAWTKSKK